MHTWFSWQSALNIFLQPFIALVALIGFFLIYLIFWVEASASTNLTYKINLGITETNVMAAPEWCVQIQTWPCRADVK